LRCVRAVESEFAGVGLLALGEDVRRKAVLPAQMVPIIHVLAEDDGLRVQPFEKTVGRRATGAALGGEEFHQHRRALRIGSAGGQNDAPRGQ